ncbi:MAG: hypothetical protein ACRYGR_01190, partial [Janthinobacterium lividum]
VCFFGGGYDCFGCFSFILTNCHLMLFIWIGIFLLFLSLCVLILVVEAVSTMGALRRPYPLDEMPQIGLEDLKAGDLVLYRYGTQSQSKIISYFSHVSILCEIENQLMVAELNEIPTESFNGHRGAMSIRPAHVCLPEYLGLVCVRPRRHPLNSIQNEILTGMVLQAQTLGYPPRPVVGWCLAKLGLNTRFLGDADRNCAAFVCAILNALGNQLPMLDELGSFPGHLASRDMDTKCVVWDKEHLYKRYEAQLL